MKMKLVITFCLILSIFFLTMCTTVESPAEVEPSIEPEPAVEQPVQPVSEPEPEVEQEAVVEEFVPSEELYTETFEDIRKIISNLNKVISSKDYDTWLGYLTDDYIAYYSDKARLEEYTELYKKRGYSYRIDSLKDYFLYLVVLSRANAVVDEIIFIDQTHIKAMTNIKGTLSILYYLEKVENEWKIGVKSEK